MKIVTLDKWLPHSERSGVLRVSTIVLHATAGGTAQSTIDWLRNPWAMVKGVLTKFPDASYHYIIERDGTIYKCVPTTKKAWHAGVSKGPHGSLVNDYSIGIAFANRNDGEEVTPEQAQAAQDLIHALWVGNRHLAFCTTHRLITSRKSDPKGFGFYEFVKHRTMLKPWRLESLGRDWD